MSKGNVEQWMVEACKKVRIEIHDLKGKPGTCTSQHQKDNADWLQRVAESDAKIIAAHAPSPSETGWKRMKAEAYERGVRDAASASCVECQEEILALLQSNTYRGKEPTK